MGHSVEFLNIDIVGYKAGEFIEHLEDDSSIVFLTLDGQMVSLEEVTGEGDFEYVARCDFYCITGKAQHEDSAIGAYLSCETLADLFDSDGPDLLRLAKMLMESGSPNSVVVCTFVTLVYSWYVTVYRDDEGFGDADEEWHLVGILNSRLPDVSDPWTTYLQLTQIATEARKMMDPVPGNPSDAKPIKLPDSFVFRIDELNRILRINDGFEARTLAVSAGVSLDMATHFCEWLVIEGYARRYHYGFHRAHDECSIVKSVDPYSEKDFPLFCEECEELISGPSEMYWEAYYQIPSRIQFQST